MKNLPIQFYAGSRLVCFMHAVEQMNKGSTISAKAIANEDEWGYNPECYVCRDAHEQAQKLVCPTCGGKGKVPDPNFLMEFMTMDEDMPCPKCKGTGQKI